LRGRIFFSDAQPAPTVSDRSFHCYLLAGDAVGGHSALQRTQLIDSALAKMIPFVLRGITLRKRLIV
ncbi:MAG: hypothetical protein IKX03_01585, partial [Bacteroidales bacterium]|nr:hypothetical protein [Bacteroidales bacterium]